MAGFPELVASIEQDKRIYTLTLEDENADNRDIEGQNVRLVIYDRWNNKKYLDAYGTVITTDPAVVKFIPEDSDIPASGAYLVKVYIEEHDDPDDTDTDLTYREPYKKFSCYIDSGPSLETTP